MSKKATYYIISISYWQNDMWAIEEAGINSRDEAEKKLKEYEHQDWEDNFHPPVINYDIKNGRKYRMVSKTELIREYKIKPEDYHRYRQQ